MTIFHVFLFYLCLYMIFTPVINEFHHIWRKGTETIPQGKQLIKCLCHQFIPCQSCCTIFSSYMTHVKPLLLVIKSVAGTVALLALSVSQYIPKSSHHLVEIRLDTPVSRFLVVRFLILCTFRRRRTKYLVLQWVFSFWTDSVRNCNNFNVYTVNCPISVREVYILVYYTVVNFQYYPLGG